MAVLEGGVRHVLPVRGLAGRPCGLVPIDGPCRASTAGLRWDVQDAELRFGALVSTSNAVEGAEVEVYATGPLLWTLALEE
ncbi:unnamed protein product [Prorocentrum cordatum]|uniref:Thiamin pyrophosphokinase thiamin-binding domain-containing protein n=1 Tax=Prorocentrum cordatum TaxID=2364126 RepID=A0ABN9RD29_9DINO|nr:unnamed protein product [Polarella glacialis]